MQHAVPDDAYDWRLELRLKRKDQPRIELPQCFRVHFIRIIETTERTEKVANLNIPDHQHSRQSIISRAFQSKHFWLLHCVRSQPSYRQPPPRAV